MRYRQLTPSGDASIFSGYTAFLINSPAAVGQSALTRLKLLTDEWFLDVTVGTPYKQAVIGKYTTGTYDAAIKTRILATQGVVSIAQYNSSLSPTDRNIGVTATINTIYGQTELQADLAI